MDALVKALESRGFKVSILTGSFRTNDCVTAVSVLGVRHEFELRETLKQIKNEPSKEEKRGAWTPYSMYDYVPSGRFTLAITSYIGEGARNSWADGKKQKVEDCLNDFIVGLVKGSVIHRARDLQREHEEKQRRELARQREEDERQREEEKKRIQTLVSEAQSWKQSQLIREYIQAVRAKALEKFGQISAGSEIDQWLKWALQQADRFDPLGSTSLEPEDYGE